MNDSFPSLPALSGINSTQVLEERVTEYKSQIEAIQFEGLHSLYKAGEIHASSTRSTSPSQDLTLMSSINHMNGDQVSPTRKRPLLPPINPSAIPQQSSKFSSPISAAPSLSEARSSNLHGLLNHAGAQERSHSASPASTIGPETPGTTLPSVNALTGRYPIGSMDSKKFLGMPSPPHSTKSLFPSLPRLTVQGEGRRNSDASLFSTASSTNTSFNSSFGGHRQSPPAAHTINSAYQTPNGGYQFMTASGLVVPLDTHQASRIADEKRKRNAGASARFRQRRKEKEKESVTAISRLETKVKELEDMNVWYRTERDRLRQVCINHGLQAHVGPRPSSPSLTKASSNESTVTTPSEWQQQGDRGNDHGRNQRRRVDYFEGAQITPQAQQGNGHSLHESVVYTTPRLFAGSQHHLESPSAGRPHFQHQPERHYITAR